MNPPELAEVETRLRRLERHNRILIGLLLRPGRCRLDCRNESFDQYRQ
jgi:hypothetical protein